MEFLQPSMLWGLLLLAVPILVHLFYFRRYKKVYFSNVAFLKSVQEEQSTMRKLRNLLVLLSRILALAFLVFAFAQPFIAKNNIKKGKKVVSIFVDNSFSMTSDGEAVSLLDEAKQRARELVEAQATNTRIQILTHQWGAQNQRWLNREDAMTVIADIEARPEVRPLQQHLEFQERMLNKVEEERKIRYIISDFQQSIADNMELDSNYETYFIPIQSSIQNNVSVDSIWFESPIQVPNENSLLYARFKNHADRPANEIKVNLKINDEYLPGSIIDLEAGESVIDTFSFSPKRTGWTAGEVQIEDYPVTFDNTYHFSFDVPDQIQVLSIFDGRNNAYLNAALKGMQGFQATAQSLGNVNYGSFGDYELIILQNISQLSTGLQSALERFLEAGGNVLVFPSDQSDLSSYNAWFQRLGSSSWGDWNTDEGEVFQIDQASNVFSNVYERTNQRLALPKVNGYYPTKSNSRSPEIRLMSLRSGAAFLSQYQSKSGFLFVCSSPLDPEYNNLVNVGEVFIPLLYRSALLSNNQIPAAFTIGKENSFSIKKPFGVGEADFEIQGAKNFIPGQRNLGANMLIQWEDQIEEAGFYNLNLQDSLQALFAMNFDRRESNLNIITSAELEEKYAQKAEVIQLVSGRSVGEQVELSLNGHPLWKYCLILCLVFLLIEQLILRLWKVE